MSKELKPVRSFMHWVNPPEAGQTLSELEWTFIDVFADGKVVLRDDPPTAEQIEQIVRELSGEDQDG